MCRDCEYGDYKYIADEPKHPYEILDEALSRKGIRDSIAEGYKQWLEDTAREYFCDVGEWNDEWKDAWREIIGEIV